ncbi:hypothetical protein [Methylobacterium sp. Leaf399]|uniref:hypothetical protein n=1 Tax=Methylobacterium sp. Leaf399 TaxID=1736364 RepID=UPI0012E34347|nr:hypothetical protein [Methylobacterium sp. Leaf399]
MAILSNAYLEEAAFELSGFAATSFGPRCHLDLGPEREAVVQALIDLPVPFGDHLRMVSGRSVCLPSPSDRPHAMPAQHAASGYSTAVPVAAKRVKTDQNSRKRYSMETTVSD